MRFLFFTEWPDVVGHCLYRQNFIGVLRSERLELGQNGVDFDDDTLYRELAQWSAAAFACGLIESPRIERM